MCGMKSIRWLVWLSLGLALLLAGCGATTAKTADVPSPTATTALPTATLTATPLPTPNASQLTACGLTAATRAWLLGNLVVTVDLVGYSYPSRQLPDGTPLAPFHVIVPSGGSISSATVP